MILELDRTWCVYKHTTPENKVYIGATGVNPIKRWNYGYGYRNSSFYEAIKIHGWNNIKHEIVRDCLTKDEAYELEKELIEQYKSTNREYGFNIAVGGHGSTGVQISEETREKLVKSHLGKSVPHTEEWNRKIAESNKGKKKPHAGVPRSEECIRKMREAKSKPVVQYTDNMLKVHEYSSIREASLVTGIKNQNISACCLGKTKTAGGYVWKYRNKTEE